MPIIGSNYDKISVERLKPLSGELKIGSDLTITGVKFEKINVGPEEKDVLKVSYQFLVKYEPKMALIDLSGHLLLMEPEKELKRIEKDWNKKQVFDDELTMKLLNNIMARTSVKALTLAQEMGLPPHIKLPRVAAKPKDAQ